MPLASVKVPLVAAVLAAIGASLCCLGPLLLLTLGLGGAWMVELTALTPWRPVFIGLTFACIGLAGYRLYGPAQPCAGQVACAEPRVRKRQRLIFWGVAVLLLGLLLVPWFAPWFY